MSSHPKAGPDNATAATASVAAPAAAVTTSQYSHQVLNLPQQQEQPSHGSQDDDGDDSAWKAMPALGPVDHYDDYGHLVAKAAADFHVDSDDGDSAPAAVANGYSRVLDDDNDLDSINSLDDNAGYLFKEPQSNALAIEDDEPRDLLSQLQMTKELLTEGQRIAYVGLTKLSIFHMMSALQSLQSSKSTKRCYSAALDSITQWGQRIMIQLYKHMDIDAAEQVMIEQLAHHGVQPSDLVPTLMQNTSVKNPVSDSTQSSRPQSQVSKTPGTPDTPSPSTTLPTGTSEAPSPPPPPYEKHKDDDVPDVKTPDELPTTQKNLDIDLRWTVLCDLFLVLVSESDYDSRSRRLLEVVAETMDVSWHKICRFEKRVIDSIEMQEQSASESWDQEENMEKRRKAALKKRYVAMGLATVGGGLVIGLSAGLLAPVIGAGLAAGLSTIGISGTGAFLGGTGGTALIASGATVTGSTVAVRASSRRTDAVKTFEYRPLYNNKKLNMIITVSGWMTGKVDDVRLPFSTVDPIMGDIYSLLWEPQLLQSMGATINILATEALTQGLQQVLGSTILTALMSSLQLPLILTKLAYLIDNPWNVSLDRADAAGLILADSLIARNLGNRPVTLVGFSLGAKVIFSCLKELAKKRAFGLVQNVYLLGSPIVAKRDEYFKARTAVAGRFVNCYASNDWILGYLFRATSGGIMRVAGLAPVEMAGVENFNATQWVKGHMGYRAAIPRILRELGWEIESDDFVEIEEPDPDNHAERQRELIREIDDARRKADEEPEKKRFGIFSKGKLAEKKGWETYTVDPKAPEATKSRDSMVLFDVDAIRAELAGEQMEVKELDSTMPPMKLDLERSLDESLAQTKPKTESSKEKDKVKDTKKTDEDDYDYDEERDAEPADHHNHNQTSPRRPASPSAIIDPVWASLHEHHDHDHDHDHDSDGMQMTFEPVFQDDMQPQHPASPAPAPDPSTKPNTTRKSVAFDYLDAGPNVWAEPEQHVEDDLHDGDGVHMTFE